MDPSDDDVQTLLAMGFPSESEVRRALKMAKNDLSDAVDILTNGQVMSTFDDLQGPTSGSHDVAAVSTFLTKLVQLNDADYYSILSTRAWNSTKSKQAT